MTQRDPLGPGTPAWNQFDNALEAYIEGNHKRYDNCRLSMKYYVARAGGDVKAWCDALRDRLAEEGFVVKPGPKP